MSNSLDELMNDKNISTLKLSNLDDKQARQLVEILLKPKIPESYIEDIDGTSIWKAL